MSDKADVIFDVKPGGFDTEVLEASRQGPIVVDFWAPWCAPCRMLGPILERVVASLDGQARLAKVNIEEDMAIASRWGITGIPAVKVFKDGRVIGEFVGALPESEVRRQLTALLPSPADELVAEGDRLAEAGDLEAAEAKYREARQVDVDHPRASLRLAEVALDRGAYQEAKDLASKAAASAPGDAEADALLGRIWFLEQCAAAGGMEACERRHADDPDDREAGFAWACCLAARGEYAEALEQFLALVRRERKHDKTAPKDAMVRIFSILGPDDELTRSYRKQLSRELYV